MKGKKLLGSLLAVVVLLAVMTTPVMAADTEITGTVPESIELDVPATFALNSLDPASSPVESGPHTATVDANHTGWTLEVIEAGTPDGKMNMVDTPATTLTNAMLAKGGDETTYTSLAGAVTLESSGAAGGGQTIDVYYQQAVTWGDEAGDYTITVTFTATAATP